jgi:hypothetical protein
MSVTTVSTIDEGYKWAKDTPSNIHEHIEMLSEYAEKCTSVVELGVNEMVSSWAFIKGLRFNKKKKKHLVCVDNAGKPSKFDGINDLAKKNKITMEFVEGDSNEIEIPKVDLLFIDTIHTYAQLSRELERHHSNVKKYIIMHNTECDGKYGEVIRMCYYYNIKDLVKKYGYPIAEMCKGLQPAIDDFLKNHPEWKLEKQVRNNNGMTVLARVGIDKSVDDE